MRLGRVLGCLWCSAKDESLHAQKLLVIQPIDADGRDNGDELIAIDAVGSGAGEVVYWCRGQEAAFAFGSDKVGSDASVVGIVDSLNRGSSVWQRGTA